LDCQAVVEYPFEDPAGLHLVWVVEAERVS